VAVRADDDVAGSDQSVFGQDGVLDAHVSAFVIVGDVHLACKVAHDLDLLGGIDVLVRREVITDQGHAVLVEDLSSRPYPAGLDGQGAVISLASTRETRHWTICPSAVMG
jgi:hypothetical protein